MSTPTARPLPLDELEQAGANDVPIWPAFKPQLIALYEQGQALLSELATIRQQQGSAESKLPTFDGPECKTYREWAAKATSKVEAIDAEYNPEIQKHLNAVRDLKAAAAERKKKVTATVTEQKTKALTEIAKAIKVDVDVDGVIAKYKTTSDQLNAVVKMFVDFPGTDAFTALKGFKLPGPGVATGATKVAKGSGAEGQKRFRWGTVTVHLPGGDLTLTQPNTKEIAAKVNIQQHNFLTALLTSLNGNYDNLPREPETPHTFEAGGHRVTLALRKAEPRKQAENTDVAEVTNVSEPIAA